MSDLVAFLLARIGEDEAVARAARSRSSYGLADSAFEEAVELAQGEGATAPSLAHIARWDPARVLAECAAKRRIVEDIARVADEVYEYDLMSVLRLLALPYADHPDFDPAWRPEQTA